MANAHIHRSAYAPDWGSEVGRSAGEGFNKGLSSVFEQRLKQQYNEQEAAREEARILREEQRQSSKLNEAFNMAQQIQGNPNLNNEQKRFETYKAFRENPGLAKALAGDFSDLQKQEKEENFWNRLFPQNNAKQAPQGQGRPVIKPQPGIATGTQRPGSEVNLNQPGSEEPQEQPQEAVFNPETFSDLQLAAMAKEYPEVAKNIMAQKKMAMDKRIEDRKSAAEDREYAYKVSKPTVEKAHSLRDNLPEMQAASFGMEDAINSNQIGPLSLDSFGVMLGGTSGNALLSAKGGQFLAASKTFLGKSVQEVGGARPNQYIEQQLARALAEIGRSKWANLSAHEFQKLKVDLAQNWLDTYDKISDDYVNTSGYVPANIDSMISKEMKPYTENRLKLLESKLKEIEKMEKMEAKPNKGFIRVEHENGTIADVPLKGTEDWRKEMKTKGWKVVK